LLWICLMPGWTWMLSFTTKICNPKLRLLILLTYCALYFVLISPILDLLPAKCWTHKQQSTHLMCSCLKKLEPGNYFFGTALFYSCLIALFLFLLILSNSQHHLLQVGAFAREVVSPLNRGKGCHISWVLWILVSRCSTFPPGQPRKTWPCSSHTVGQLMKSSFRGNLNKFWLFLFSFAIFASFIC